MKEMKVRKRGMRYKNNRQVKIWIQKRIGNRTNFHQILGSTKNLWENPGHS